ncbi:flagellar hook-basal body complex protein [Caproicibacter fermentans]|uniref:Flagellar hook protein FlgE n=1 Tax=Caproicibacter fermentans TaxID=2576756 RepID=A0A7G8TFI3_9FIRM|nr:flagellar hook-basal body complex protein [Caproicibacter fermentans]QNK42374.1 flagellar hook-basal body complex protein [Caproicibacter fermentans]
MAMMRAMSSGVAGLKAHQTGLDVIGNNIANVNTYGFKASRTLFSDVLYQTLTSATAPGFTKDGDGKVTADNGTGGINPSQVGYGSTASSVTVDTGRAGMATTGFGGDCYINGEGYFVVGTGKPTDDVPASYQYTRVGALSFDSAGYLVDGHGNRVCGVSNSAPATLAGALDTVTGNKPEYIHYTLPDGTGTDDAKNNVFDSVAIGEDGTITATNAAGKVVTIGQIYLAHFSNPGGLEQEGGNYYKDTGNSGDALCATPGSGSTGKLVTGALESSNVDLANEFSNMISTERGYQANSKIITVSDTMLETLVNMVR